MEVFEKLNGKTLEEHIQVVDKQEKTPVVRKTMIIPWC